MSFSEGRFNISNTIYIYKKKWKVQLTFTKKYLKKQIKILKNKTKNCILLQSHITVYNLYVRANSINEHIYLHFIYFYCLERPADQLLIARWHSFR